MNIGNHVKYKILTTVSFDKAYDKLNDNDKNLVDEVIDKLASGQNLEAKYRDHKLNGKYRFFRDCHIKNDLVLIYERNQKALILTAMRLGTHSEIF